ncbi:hypothetical protein ElyMa_004426400 [Elysia marginata]|uniref:Uncharacterized protein n=1 Tax=Elysia marginata TaxID=1093978 RepID=A0AAV4HF23_9GAST|nr:hypothetical protein ElyMa_004426400 [Elysia marginata]
MYQAIKKFTSNKRTSSGGCVKNKKGDMLFGTEEIMKRWTEYVEDLFDDTRSELDVHSFLQGPDILPTEVESALHQGKMDGSRGRGHRRKSWTANIAEMTNMRVNAAAKAAMEREGRRSMASNFFKEKEPS